jgi:hypothetical protein
MTNGTAVKVVSKDGKRILFFGTYHWTRDGLARVYRRGHVTLVAEAQVKPVVSC